MKNYKNKLFLISVLISVFILGYLTNLLFNEDEPLQYINETTELILDYSKLPFAIDSIEQLSIAYYDTANVEMLHYVMNYNDVDVSKFPDYYITNFGDTIDFNKENFYYYVALYMVAENLLTTRKHIINGLLINNNIIEQNKITDGIVKNDKNTHNLENNLQKLQSIKTALMQDLLSGKKRVTELLKEEAL